MNSPRVNIESAITERFERDWASFCKGHTCFTVADKAVALFFYRLGRDDASRPDFLSEAINSGDGSYRP